MRGCEEAAVCSMAVLVFSETRGITWGGIENAEEIRSFDTVFSWKGE